MYVVHMYRSRLWKETTRRNRFSEKYAGRWNTWIQGKSNIKNKHSGKNTKKKEEMRGYNSGAKRSCFCCGGHHTKEKKKLSDTGHYSKVVKTEKYTQWWKIITNKKGLTYS